VSLPVAPVFTAVNKSCLNFVTVAAQDGYRWCEGVKGEIVHLCKFIWDAKWAIRT